MLNFGIFYVVKNFHGRSGDEVWFFVTVLNFTSCILLNHIFICTKGYCYGILRQFLGMK